MRCNEEGLDLIRRFEGLRLKADRCPAGVLTIGYGHTKGVNDDDAITVETAERLLLQDVTAVEEDMRGLIQRHLNDNQWSACVSWVYNLGATRIRASRTLSLLNRGLFPEFSSALLTWNKAGGRELPGLTRRREAERELFLRPVA